MTTTFFKTKLCPLNQEGTCPKGDTCSYAHSNEEIRQQPNLTKTKLCMLYQAGTFIHNYKVNVLTAKLVCMLMVRKILKIPTGTQ